ncbi:hypothetical protein [Bordetella sp. N]|uniref:hypothetical protein n=1 Tax=Bordetella sp. N TaxID=1746199 RepID=UPI00070D0F84|nr:hypothetical protein [Bordetella sp. N]ALM86088.1 hypothetical protein ASB57_26840 [Bordetella sp. N]
MGALSLERFGSFHIGGRVAQVDDLPPRQVRYSKDWIETFDPNGGFAVEQMYVQFFVPSDAHAVPLVFWPGGGMTGVNFETTPDGRPGWVDFFLRQGRTVYNTDPVERGRSGWAMFPEIFEDAPIFMTRQRAFESFRFGEPDGYHEDPAQRRALPGTQFPLEAFDRFVQQIVPRWTHTGAAAQKAYQQLLEQTGPAVVFAFSSGGTQALQLAERHPELFAGLVLLEPAGTGLADKGDSLRDIPLLALYGDFLDRHPLWPGIRQRLQAYLEPGLTTGKASIVDLPTQGIRGNSHFLMMDRNNLELAALVETWLARNVRGE